MIRVSLFLLAVILHRAVARGESPTVLVTALYVVQPEFAVHARS